MAASSCGKEYCPDTKCTIKHPFNGGKRARCERIKGCQNNICAPFAGLGTNGFVLYDVCLQQCHLNEGDKNYPGTYSDYNEYLCTLYTPEDIIQYYQVNPCGGNPDNTVTGKEDQKKKEVSAANNTLLIGIGVVLLVAISFIFLRKK